MFSRKLFTLIASVALAVSGFMTSEINAAAPARAAKPVISILGDSYSTFQGYIPEGNEIWYFNNPTPDRTDVDDVKQTWWWQLISQGGYILGQNDSWSGATISYRGYFGEDYTNRSFITRIPRLGSPDILLVFGATNDSWAGVEVGEFNYDNEIPNEQLYTFRPAMSRLLSGLINRYPGTEIYFIINSELRDDITSSIREICDHYSVKYIQLHDIDKISGHPSRKGMKAIAEQVLDVIGK